LEQAEIPKGGYFVLISLADVGVIDCGII